MHGNDLIVPDAPYGGAVVAEQALGFAGDAAKFVHLRPVGG